MYYKISRMEEQGESLFICINSNNTKLEHFFTEEEKLDKIGTIEGLVAELEIKEEDFIAPAPRISKLEEARAFVLDPKKIEAKKNKIKTKLTKVKETNIIYN